MPIFVSMFFACKTRLFLEQKGTFFSTKIDKKRFFSPKRDCFCNLFVTKIAFKKSLSHLSTTLFFNLYNLLWNWIHDTLKRYLFELKKGPFCDIYGWIFEGLPRRKKTGTFYSQLSFTQKGTFWNPILGTKVLTRLIISHHQGILCVLLMLLW